MPEEKRVSQAGGGGKAETAGAAKAKQSSLSDTVRRFEDAHLNYFRELRDIWVQTQDQFNEAFRTQARKFAESTQNADPATRFQAYRENVEQLQKSVNPDDVKQRFEEAYRNHLRALKDAWANVDVDALDLSSGA
jgi:hypothetical protein